MTGGMNLYRWSSLARGYDLGLNYNQIILGVSILAALFVAVGRLVVSGSGWLEVFLDGFTGGATAFSAGLLAKELVPDYPQAAVTASVISLAVVWYARFDSIPLIFWLAGSMRLLNRTTGLAVKLTDILVLLVVTGWLIWVLSPLIGLLMAAVLWLDSRLPDGRKSSLFAGAMTLLLTVVYVLARQGLQPPAMNSFWVTAGLLIITVLFVPIILNSNRVQATGDATGESLNPARVQAGQFAALATGLVTASWLGTDGIIVLIALWSALLAAAIHHFARRSRRQQPISI